MSGMSRRTFLWITGGSGLALATDPPRKLVNKLIPQVIPPENIKPGEWVAFATTCRECPAGCGMHLMHRDGRVTKAEGNPQHPVNRGALCPRGQAALQGLYDPDRLSRVQYRPRQGRPQRSSWDQALGAIAGHIASARRVTLLSSLQTGSLAEVMQRFAAAFPAGRMLMYEPFSHQAQKQAHHHLFGQPVIPTYQLEQCQLILSFSADFLETWISPVSYAIQFKNMHGRVRSGEAGRMVYVGPRLSMTAANADQFLQVPPGAERLVALALVRIILRQGWNRQPVGGLESLLQELPEQDSVAGIPAETLVELARRFVRADASVALAGPVGSVAPAATGTAAAVGLLNHVAGRVGQTVDFGRPHALSQAASEEELEQALDALGPSDLLLIHDCNPCYSRPWTAERIRHAGAVVYLGTLMDETASQADWVLPLDYPLESWSDYEPSLGTHGIMQPTLGRLYDTRSAGDLLLALARLAGKELSRSEKEAPADDFLSWLMQRWKGLAAAYQPGLAWEDAWKDILARGGLWQEGEEKGKGRQPVRLLETAGQTLKIDRQQGNQPATVQLWLWSSIMLYDGRLANRGWLQEAPDPLTFYVWSSWVDMHPATAAGLKLKDGDLVELATAAGSLQAPLRLTPEVAQQTAALAMGQGHTAMGRHARGTGANGFALLAPGNPSGMFGSCRIRRIGRATGYGGDSQPVVTTHHRDQFQREVLQWVPQSRLAAMKPGEGDELILPLPEGYRAGKDLYPRREYLRHRWAMVIDLQRCIGCGACSVACYAENNIAVVGKQRVAEGREMAWLRVAPYRKPGSSMSYGWLPMLCQHCDAAPCEPVCPVFAAMHNEEGLNAQIYNRCIGTRYCSNNCPYKVRRFNWINIPWNPPLDLQLNPEVTVRSRGVMEKCTFCVQRIRQAEYRATRERRRIRDGEVQPACVQTCPTRVFTFGDLLDPAAEVTRLTRSDPRRYHVLEELNTKPAVTYLRKVDLDG